MKNSGNYTAKESKEVRITMMIMAVQGRLQPDDMPHDYNNNNLRYSIRALLQLISLLLIIAAFLCTLTIPNLRTQKLFDLEWWKWEVMIFVVICGRLVSGWVFQIMIFFLDHRSLLIRKRVLYFVFNSKEAIQNCVWFGLILIAWLSVLAESLTYGKKVFSYVTKIWICVLVGSVIWLLKTLMIKVLASNFHISKYLHRIQDSLFNQYVIKTLSAPPEIQQEQEQEQEQEEEQRKPQESENVGASLLVQLKAYINGGATPKKQENGITIQHVQMMNLENISAWNMNRMMNAFVEASMQITNENHAEIAKKIFCVVEPNSKCIDLEDLMRFLSYDEGLKTIRLFNDGASETNGISKRALKNWVVNVFRERADLARSLEDIKSVVDDVHQMLNAVMGMIIIVIWLLILELETTRLFKFLCAILVLVSIVYGDTCKTTVEALMFFFIAHPFGVGDLCMIDDGGDEMTVEEMNISTTVFLGHENRKIVYRNSVLYNKRITTHYHHSPRIRDNIRFCINVFASEEKFTKMKGRIKSYVNSKSDHWQAGPEMEVIGEMDLINRLKISLLVSRQMNIQDKGDRAKRRELLVKELIKIFKDLDIDYSLDNNLPAVASK